MSTSPTARLSSATVDQIRDAVVPTYDRSAHPSITHLGMGAFARAHLGVYADDLLRSGWAATIRAVSLRSPRAAEQLSPQDGLYTVIEREPDSDRPARVIGSVTSCATGPGHAVEAIADPVTRLITLTVTEKGYDADAADSAPAVLVRGLQRRYASGSSPPVIASMDNLLDNGVVLRGRVLEVATATDPALAGWIADSVAFPNTVVDRMVPATTPNDVESVSRRLGVVDLATVSAEHYRSWVITDCDGLPPLADAGVEVVGDIGAFQQRKLWLLNAPHSALAYCGLLAGCATIADAADDPAVAAALRDLTADILEVADLPSATRPAGFAKEAMQRFRNPALGHTCVQVGADGSRKLPQRLLPVVASRLERGLPTDRFAAVVAAWLAAAGGLPLRGVQLPVVADPASSVLRDTVANGGLRRLVAAGLGTAVDPRFDAQVVTALTALVQDGPMALFARP